MELPIIKFRIDKSVLELEIDDDKISKIIELLSTFRDEQLFAYVSGQPLHIYNDNSDIHFKNCDVRIQERVQVGRVYVNRVPRLGHPDVPSEFLSDVGYSAMQCLDKRGNEVVMGMRSILGFEIEFLST